jgi:hypothetical protein
MFHPYNTVSVPHLHVLLLDVKVGVHCTLDPEGCSSPTQPSKSLLCSHDKSRPFWEFTAGKVPAAPTSLFLIPSGTLFPHAYVCVGSLTTSVAIHWGASGRVLRLPEKFGISAPHVNLCGTPKLPYSRMTKHPSITLPSNGEEVGRVLASAFCSRRGRGGGRGRREVRISGFS